MPSWVRALKALSTSESVRTVSTDIVRIVLRFALRHVSPASGRKPFQGLGGAISACAELSACAAVVTMFAGGPPRRAQSRGDAGINRNQLGRPTSACAEPRHGYRHGGDRPRAYLRMRGAEMPRSSMRFAAFGLPPRARSREQPGKVRAGESRPSGSIRRRGLPGGRRESFHHRETSTPARSDSPTSPHTLNSDEPV